MHPAHRYRWAAPGDVNAFCGLCIDNLAGLVLTVSLLATVFGYPPEFALTHLVPGTAVGVVAGDLLFTWLAFRLARRAGRTDVTAMPLGLDTPSTFGMVFFVVGPAFTAARATGLEELAAARHAWQIGICSLVASGLFKLAASLVAGSIHRAVPRAALLGSLTAIALALITFLPMLEIVSAPLVGLVSLGIVLASLTAHLPVPGRLPGALLALAAGWAVHAAGATLGWTPVAPHPAGPAAAVLWPTDWLAALRLEWVAAWRDTLPYLPIVIPFALGTVVGGIDCAESAAAAGDEYRTGDVIAIEAVATLAAGLCGGVIQTTPYIGHPAYKAMGGRAAYTLATAVFIGGAGLTGTFAWIYQAVPAAAILPVLVFIGLEITAQSFHATPPRHYPAVAIACVPALAALVKIQSDKLLAAGAEPGPQLEGELFCVRILAAGFIVTSVLWAGLLTALLDRALLRAAAWTLAGAGCAVCGVIHSPFADGRLFLPWHVGELPAAAIGRTPWHFAAAYAVLAALFAGWGLLTPPDRRGVRDDAGAGFGSGGYPRAASTDRA